VWPNPEGTPSRSLPPAVVTGRIVFESQSGEACCVAIDPALISGSAQRGLAVLTDLAPGGATVRVAGFTTDFAPTSPGIVTPCKTIPPNIGVPCDLERVASPAFESDPIFVTIVGGTRTNIGTVEMSSYPFVYAFSPGQDESAPAPVQFALTVTDAINNIRADSLTLDVLFTLPVEHPTPGESPFRSLSKRVPLSLTACDDRGGAPCSASGTLELAGFKAVGTAPELPEGEVQARIVAENIADPPRAVDFRYSFIVLATPTATATATTSAASGTPATILQPADGSSSVPTRGGLELPSDAPNLVTPPPGRAAGARGATSPTPTRTPRRDA